MHCKIYKKYSGMPITLLKNTRYYEFFDNENAAKWDEVGVMYKKRRRGIYVDSPPPVKVSHCYPSIEMYLSASISCAAFFGIESFRTPFSNLA